DAPVVVGIDGSEHSREALRWAVEAATARRTSVRAVMAWSYLAQPGPDGPAPFHPEFQERDVRSTLEEVLRTTVPDGAETPVQAVAVLDLAAHALLEQAADAQLLVVGARGLGGLRGLLLGSVSQQVVHHAHLPVVVVRQR